MFDTLNTKAGVLWSSYCYIYKWLSHPYIEFLDRVALGGIPDEFLPFQVELVALQGCGHGSTL